MARDDAAHALRAIPALLGLSLWYLDGDRRPSTFLTLDAGADADGGPWPPVRPTDPFRPDDAAVLDAVQLLDCGPGTDAVAAGRTTTGAGAPDLHRRWPLFGHCARARGVGAVVAVPVPSGAVVAYLSEPTVVDDELVRSAQALGSLLAPSVPAPRVQTEPEHEVAAGYRSTMAVASVLVERELAWPVGTGEGRIVAAALRAGVAPEAFAVALVEVFKELRA